MTSDEQPADPGTTRRSVIAGAGAVGATAFLAACSGSADDTTSAGKTGSTAGTSGSTAMAGTAAGTRLAAVSDIPVGGGVVIPKAKVVVTQPTQGHFRAFTAVCTHQQCLVTEVKDGTINCPCHRSQFSVADGSVKGGPAPSPLAAVQIKVDGKLIELA